MRQMCCRFLGDRTGDLLPCSEISSLGLLESRFLACAITSIAVRLFGGRVVQQITPSSNFYSLGLYFCPFCKHVTLEAASSPFLSLLVFFIFYSVFYSPFLIFSQKITSFDTVPDSKSRNIPEVVIVRRGAVGVLGIWKGRDSWVKSGANRVSLQAT
jgi:hypothetical protein